MAEAPIRIDASSLKDLEKRLTKMLKVDGKKATEDSLRSAHEIITNAANSAISRHRRSGRTERSLDKSAKVEWSGDQASIGIGFDRKKGGIAAKFLIHGTPRMRPDKNMYDAFYGSNTLKKIEKATQNATKAAFDG